MNRNETNVIPMTTTSLSKEKKKKKKKKKKKMKSTKSNPVYVCPREFRYEEDGVRRGDKILTKFTNVAEFTVRRMVFQKKISLSLSLSLSSVSFRYLLTSSRGASGLANSSSSSRTIAHTFNVFSLLRTGRKRTDISKNQCVSRK